MRPFENPENADGGREEEVERVVARIDQRQGHGQGEHELGVPGRQRVHREIGHVERRKSIEALLDQGPRPHPSQRRLDGDAGQPGRHDGDQGEQGGVLGRHRQLADSLRRDAPGDDPEDDEQHGRDGQVNVGAGDVRQGIHHPLVERRDVLVDPAGDGAVDGKIRHGRRRGGAKKGGRMRMALDEVEKQAGEATAMPAATFR